jgi:hypothetical protein
MGKASACVRTIDHRVLPEQVRMFASGGWTVPSSSGISSAELVYFAANRLPKRVYSALDPFEF